MVISFEKLMVGMPMVSRETVSKKRLSSGDLAARERKKTIASIDPQVF